MHHFPHFYIQWTKHLFLICFAFVLNLPQYPALKSKQSHLDFKIYNTVKVNIL